MAYDASRTRGIFHVPLRVDGDLSFGQYSRSIRTKRSAGAGSQFASLSAPGESCWRYRSTEPSGFVFSFSRWLSV